MPRCKLLYLHAPVQSSILCCEEPDNTIFSSACLCLATRSGWPALRHCIAWGSMCTIACPVCSLAPQPSLVDAALRYRHNYITLSEVHDHTGRGARPPSPGEACAQLHSSFVHSGCSPHGGLRHTVNSYSVATEVNPKDRRKWEQVFP